MNIAAAYPSRFLRAADMNGKDVTLTIQSVKVEDMGDGEKKPTVAFAGTDKVLGLNKTNARRIASMHGQETDNWVGKGITLYATETEFKGDTVPCIRIRKDEAVTTSASVAPHEVVTEDEIPF